MTIHSTKTIPLSDKPAAPFSPSNWKYILKLMGLVIVADGRTLKEEVDTFLEVVRELRAIIDPTICFTPQMARDWFALNKPDLEDIIENLSYDTAICETIAPIKSFSHKLDVISCMVRIAVSDNDYSDVEKTLIKKTCLYWNVRSDFQVNLENLHEPVTPFPPLKTLPLPSKFVEMRP